MKTRTNKYTRLTTLTIATIYAIIFYAYPVNAQTDFGLSESDLSELDSMLEEVDSATKDIDLATQTQNNDGQEDFGLGDGSNNPTVIDIKNMTDEELLNLDIKDDFLSDNLLGDLDKEIVSREYSPITSPEWDSVRSFIKENEKEGSVDWLEAMPDIETGEIHLKGVEHKSLFGLFGIDLEVSRIIDSNGNLKTINRPWYSIFAW